MERDESCSKFDLASVSNDKAFEIESKFIADEINRRMDYNRRTQGFQITTIGACFAALVSKGSASIDYGLVNALCVAVSTINGMFILEIRQNTYYQKIAALYVSDVINAKYTVQDGRKIMQWEDFLALHRKRGHSILSRLSFVGSAHLLMSIYLTAFPAILFTADLCEGRYDNSIYHECLFMTATFVFNSAMIIKYILSGLQLDNAIYFDSMLTYKPASTEDFEFFYSLRLLTMRDHFERAGKIWDDEEIARHRGHFDVNTLQMIFLRGKRIGFINVIYDAQQNIGRISHFCLDPIHQNRGIGSSVMRKVMREADKLGCMLVLDVLKKNKALRLFRRLNFAVSTGDNELLIYLKREPTFWSRFMGKARGIFEPQVFIV